jgi:hypothetical protein
VSHCELPGWGTGAQAHLTAFPTGDGRRRAQVICREIHPITLQVLPPSDETTVSRDEANTAFRPSVVGAYTNDGYLGDAYRCLTGCLAFGKYKDVYISQSR